MTSDSSSTALSTELGSQSCSLGAMPTFACCARRLSFISCVYNQSGYPVTNIADLQQHFLDFIGVPDLWPPQRYAADRYNDSTLAPSFEMGAYTLVSHATHVFIFRESS